jgi:RNA polymerase sigma-70 factor (ECF subfamily)
MVMSEPASPALSVVAEAHYDELKAFVLRKVGCPALAADIVQDMWLRVATAEPHEPVRNARAYLYRVAGNLAVDRLRQERARGRHVTAGALPDEVPSRAPAADRAMAARQELAILRMAVRDLPDKCRTVFLLYRGHGLSMRQIAASLGISEKTVEKHIAKAMVRCRARLTEAGRRI